MRLRRIVIEIEVVYDIEKPPGYEAEGLGDYILARLGDDGIEGQCKVLRDEVCTPRRAMLLLKAQGDTDEDIEAITGPLPGGAILRPSSLLESLFSGVEDDISMLSRQEDVSWTRPDLDFLLGTVQQWHQDILRGILGEDLIFHWVDVVGEVKRLIEDHGGACLMADLPSSDEEPPMRTVMIEAYREGMGPIVTLSIWDARKTHMGKAVVRYRLSSDGEIIFDGDDFGCSPLHAIDSLETMRTIVGFLTCRPSEMEADYSASWTNRQKEWAEEYGETLSLYGMDQEAPAFDWDSFDECPK